ncbi:unnamed protein product [Echinostoma caproni]|uniref:BPL/LPL catalytic domain-containing protein n=1 Tax=Echinostoma caproni TaxID=27848 RepID=A0A183AEN8_9TREM|nr:unnamed protein product [Echinostoma caproni]
MLAFLPRSINRPSSLSAIGSLLFHIPNRLSSRIFILDSGNIYRNLAFEACLYADSDRFVFNILLWRSDPCVVIGRFQNAWNEIRTDVLSERRWVLARRQSGGGAVFHDLGNLNICFMQARRVLDRRECMRALQRALQPLLPGHVVHVGERYDLWTSPEVPNAQDPDLTLPLSIYLPYFAPALQTDVKLTLTLLSGLTNYFGLAIV